MEPYRTSASTSLLTAARFYIDNRRTSWQISLAFLALYLLVALLTVPIVIVAMLGGIMSTDAGSTAGAVALILTAFSMALVLINALCNHAWVLMTALALRIVDAAHGSPGQSPAAWRISSLLHSSQLLSLRQLPCVVTVTCTSLGFELVASMHARTALAETLRLLDMLAWLTAILFWVKASVDYALSPCFVVDGLAAHDAMQLSKAAIRGNRGRLAVHSLLSFPWFSLVAVLALSGMAFAGDVHAAIVCGLVIVMLAVAPIPYFVVPLTHRELSPQIQHAEVSESGFDNAYQQLPSQGAI